MVNILHLIKETKVEWKRLWEVLIYEQPRKYIVKTTDYNDNYSTPVLTAGRSFILGFTNEREGIYKADKNKPVIIFDDFTSSIHWVEFDFKVKSSAIKILKAKDKVDLKFCYYYMKIINITIHEHRRLWISKYSNIKIPIPPIEEQKRIVSILDTFKKLEARREQYSYYRNRLLSAYKSNEDKIKNIYTRLHGIPITARKMKELRCEEGKVRIFAGGKTCVNVEEENIFKGNIIKEPSVLVQSRGIIDVIYYDKPFTFKNEMWAYTNKNQVTVKFLYYVLKNNIHILRAKASNMGTMPQISLSSTDDFYISLPPIEEQKRIVNILDKFERLTNGISEGIPQEIILRKKQYEYYREKLLDFAK